MSMQGKPVSRLFYISDFLTRTSRKGLFGCCPRVYAFVDWIYVAFKLSKIGSLLILNSEPIEQIRRSTNRELD